MDHNRSRKPNTPPFEVVEKTNRMLRAVVAPQFRKIQAADCALRIVDQ